MKRSLFILLAAAFGCLSTIFPALARNDGSRYAPHSVLSSGKWMQLKVTENAIYKLTYEDLKSMGFSDPAKVKVYGYGGWMLEENFTKPYIDDLPEIPVWINKGADGVFNAGDYLLFYGKGTVQWSYNAGTDFFEHKNNVYSTYGAYFLTENSNGPKEMTSQNSYSSTTVSLNVFDDYLVYERDSITIISSGRELFGESFTNKSTQSFPFSIPGITEDTGAARLSFAGYPAVPTPVTLSIGGKTIINLMVDAAIKSDYRKAWLKEMIQPWPQGAKSEQTVATVSYAANGTLAHLNFIALNMKRRLQFYDRAYTFFRSKESRVSNVKYTIDNAGSQAMIWELTEGAEPRVVKTTKEGNRLIFGAEKDPVLHEYVMVDPSKSFPKPQVLGEVSNQDLHALAPVDLVIISPEVYMAQAESLAEKHRTSDHLRVTVVQPDWVYNEFSSGSPDATAYRRFMKMFYDRAAVETDKPRYLLLFGDGIFDNRHLTKAVAAIDPHYYLLTYEVKESVNESTSYGTDDYFGFLDDEEGTDIGSDRMDIGVGRFPVSSLRQATNAVKKVMAYIDDKNYGEWKNNVIFTADDTGDDSYCYHAIQADSIAQFVQNNFPQYAVTKVYMDAFQPADVNGKKTYPDAKKKFLNTLQKGAFLLNYTGHGSVSGWSAEDMLNGSDVRQMKFEGLPLWITATCDFGWFDRVATTSGEEAFLNETSAAIALFTTSRVVYSDGNASIHSRLIRNTFATQNGKHLRLGDILRKSKNEVGSDFNKLNYVLLGDPALELAYPDLQVALEKINGETILPDSVYVLKALEKVTVEGSVVDPTGTIVNSFNGDVKTSVFDSKQSINAVYYRMTTEDQIYYWSYIDYPSKVYTGNRTVKDGRFAVSFTVPKDIAYKQDNGKMTFYAYDGTTGRDAHGYYKNYMLFGSDTNIDDDGEGPEISALFLNSESFRSGDKTNATPYFVARVFDKDGINLTGNGLDHDISLSIDNLTRFTYTLNSYYIPDKEEENNGEIRFSIPQLPVGKHQLTFRIWDILNNSSIATLDFTVVEGLQPHVYDLTATVVPARTSTDFLFTHDRPESVIDVAINVYDLTGRLVWTHSERGSSSWLKDYRVSWDLTNTRGDRVPAGVYVYQAIINDPGGKEGTKAKKLIVLNP
ncbi:MAG: type IX secretion system sortase PorU [Dysgonamonadaceae bacterium]|jgi:hypothetical protein|nr:type IX secretion system sortase PorU [Dysgonamonadaceae bacterium]